MFHFKEQKTLEIKAFKMFCSTFTPPLLPPSRSTPAGLQGVQGPEIPFMLYLLDVESTFFAHFSTLYIPYGPHYHPAEPHQKKISKKL